MRDEREMGKNAEGMRGVAAEIQCVWNALLIRWAVNDECSGGWEGLVLEMK